MNTNLELMRSLLASLNQLTEAVEGLKRSLQSEASVASTATAALPPPSASGLATPSRSAPTNATHVAEGASEPEVDPDQALRAFLDGSPSSRKRSSASTKHGATRLRVRLQGETICKATAVDTYVEALCRLGLERVHQLPMRLCGVPLVSTKRPGGYQSTRRVGPFYVVTHASNRAKKLVLERAARRLGKPIEIDVIA